MVYRVVLKELYIILLFRKFGGCQTLNDSNTLRKNLLDGYDKFVRPVENQTNLLMCISFLFFTCSYSGTRKVFCNWCVYSILDRREFEVGKRES